MTDTSDLIQFHVLPRGSSAPTAGTNLVYLRIDNWNDYSFITMFDVYFFDQNGERHELGNVRIGFVGQVESKPTHTTLETNFFRLPDNYFSVGTDVNYYITLRDSFSYDVRKSFLSSLRDVAYDDSILQQAKLENVFKISHLRSLSLSTIENQFRRILVGGSLVTDFDFRFILDTRSNRAGYELNFKVIAHSKPSTNIHAIIGRNGVGKTSLLNAMIWSAAHNEGEQARFEINSAWKNFIPMPRNYFSGVISISFSAFDPFNPPSEQTDPTKGTCYFYVGLKSYAGPDGAILKSLDELYNEFTESLNVCLSEVGKKQRWLSAITTLESDDNFADMNLTTLAEMDETERNVTIMSLQRRISSGHAIVLLTITKLVARLEEKTLVLFDEPESHLHPPLLSALIRSLSELLYNRNAVAIVATHSPVVLQEIPRSCVWKIIRSGVASSASRPQSETFGENVGILTREVFTLEVSKSGFNSLLSQEVERNLSYDQVLDSFRNQLGFEGRAILRSLIHSRDKN